MSAYRVTGCIVRDTHHGDRMVSRSIFSSDAKLICRALNASRSKGKP